jgi:predicted secreted protein
MKNYNHLEKHVEDKYKQRDQKKKPKMKVSGKNIFKLKELITKKNDSSSKGKNSKKNR